MNPFTRIAASISLEKADLTPVLPQIFAHTAILSGYTIFDYVHNGETAAASQLHALKYYNHDGVFNFLDLCIEPEIFGTEIKFSPNIYPVVIKTPFSQDTDFSKISIPDMSTSGRIPEVLTAARILRKSLKNQTPVIGLVQGPMTLAIQLLGAENAIYLAIDDPPRFEQLLDFTTELAISYGIAQLNAGSHLVMIFEPGGSCEVVPSSFFRELLILRLKHIFEEYKIAGSRANWLHIAGNNSEILQYYQDIGVEIANIDYSIPLELAMAKLPSICIDGNIKSLSFLSESPDYILEQSRLLLKAFAHRGGFILSSGCEIPPESLPGNIKAMVHASKNFI